MFAPSMVIVTLLVGSISAHTAKPDPTCFVIKTPLRADDCCIAPDFIQESVLEKCVTDTVPLPDQDENLKCIAECAATAVGAFKNGTIDKAAMTQLLTGTLGKDPNYGPMFGATFDKCYSQLMAIPAHKSESKCNFAPAYILNCFESGLFVNCPAKVWKESDGCKELKGKLTSGCPFMAIAGGADQ